MLSKRCQYVVCFITLSFIDFYNKILLHYAVLHAYIKVPYSNKIIINRLFGHPMIAGTITYAQLANDLVPAYRWIYSFYSIFNIIIIYKFTCLHFIIWARGPEKITCIVNEYSLCVLLCFCLYQTYWTNFCPHKTLNFTDLVGIDPERRSLCLEAKAAYMYVVRGGGRT